MTPLIWSSIWGADISVCATSYVKTSSRRIVRHMSGFSPASQKGHISNSDSSSSYFMTSSSNETQFDDDRRRTDTFFFHGRILVIHAPVSRFSSFDQHLRVFAFMMDILVIDMGERMVWILHFCHVLDESSSWRVFSVRYKSLRLELQLGPVASENLIHQITIVYKGHDPLMIPCPDAIRVISLVKLLDLFHSSETVIPTHS